MRLIRSFGTSAGRCSKILKSNGLPESFVMENCTSKDYNRVMDMMTEGFGSREPHIKALGIQPAEVRPLLENIVDNSINNPYTVKLRNTETNESLGFLLCSYGSRNQDPRFKNEGPPLDPSKLVPRVQHLVHLLEDAYKLILTKTTFENWLHGEAVFVDKKIAREGYGNFLIGAYIKPEEAANRGLDGYTGVCTAPGSHYASIKFGCREIGRNSEEFYKNLKFDNGWNKITTVARDFRMHRKS